MILVDQVHKPLQKMAALRIRQPVDVLGEPADWEDALPASDWVRADHRVHGLQVIANVLGRSTSIGVQAVSKLIRDLVEVVAAEGSLQAFEEPLVRLANPVIQLISRSPQRV